MFRAIEAETADALWLKAAALFQPNGVAVQTDGRGGPSIEVLRAALTLHDSRQRWIGSRLPAINPAFALAEVIWIVSGRNDSGFLNFFNPQLPRFAGSGPAYHGAYGYRLRRHFGFDQLERAWRVLSARKDSRQVALQIWDPAIDFPAEDGTPQAEDIPCNVIAMLKVRNDRLEWTQLMRSNDLMLGLPHNVVQFSCLQEIVAGWLGLEPGEYHHFADSLHLYERDMPIAEHIGSCDLPRNDDSISISKHESERCFMELSAFCEVLSDRAADAGIVTTAFQRLDLPGAFLSWASVIAAEGLRRRSAFREMNEVLYICTNRCLAMMFDRWLERNQQLHRSYPLIRKPE